MNNEGAFQIYTCVFRNECMQTTTAVSNFVVAVFISRIWF